MWYELRNVIYLLLRKMNYHLIYYSLRSVRVSLLVEIYLALKLFFRF